MSNNKFSLFFAFIFTCFISTTSFAISGGQDVLPSELGNGSLEDTVLLLRWFSDKNGQVSAYDSSAVVISETAVLTTAHGLCGKQSTEKSILFRGSNPDHAKMFLVKEKFMHPGYDCKIPLSQQSAENDLAIVVSFSKISRGFRVAKLLPRDFEFDSDKFKAFGFGLTKFTYETVRRPDAGQMRRVDLSKITLENNLFVNRENEAAGICKGDSGGPLFYMSSPEPYLVGINQTFIFQASKELSQDYRRLGIGSEELFQRYPKFNLCNGVGRFVDLRPQLDWIESTLKHIN